MSEGGRRGARCTARARERRAGLRQSIVRRVEGAIGWGFERKSSRSCFPGRILQLSSGECAGIPQSLLLGNVVIPKGSAAHARTHTSPHLSYKSKCPFKMMS